MPFYQDRVRWAAGRIGGDDRTVRRRIDEAIDRVARLATAGAVPDVPSSGSTSLAGWHTDELKISLILDQEVPEAFEFRRIVAERDHVDELDLAMTLTKTREFDQPSDLNDLQVDVLYGGTLVKKTLESNDRFGLVLALPAELNRNGWHDYALRYRAPGKGMLPHFVCVPKHRCDTFELRVRFDLDHPPENVWRMEDLYHRDIDTLDPVGEELRPDSAGEVHLQFHNLTPGRAYGIRWGPESGRETPP